MQNILNNIFSSSAGMGIPRYVNLAHPLAMGGFALALLLIAAGAFLAGSQVGKRQAMNDPQVQSAAWSRELARQQVQIEDTRRVLQENVNALAKRVGLMNAHVIRLDAMGERLTQMANIDKEEFNFGQAPAQGGMEGDAPVGEAPQVPDLTQMIDQLDRDLQTRELQLGVLENLLMTHKLNEEILPDGRPVSKGWISSYFGKRADPFTGYSAIHKGMDFAGRMGSDIVAVATGVVTYSGQRSGFGRMVEINHGNGYATRYAHLSSALVNVGDTIQKGQKIALMGNTGRSTGPHLHFEVLKDGVQVNPLKFIGAAK